MAVTIGVQKTLKRIPNLTVMLAVSMLTTALKGEDKLGAGLLCTRLVDRVTVSVESKRALFHETVVAVTHKDPGRIATKNSYGRFFIIPLYEVKGASSVSMIDSDLPKISVSSGKVSGLRYTAEKGISLVNGKWGGTEGVYIFDVVFGEEVPDRITFTVEMAGTMEKMDEHSRILCSLSSDGRVESESDRECRLKVVALGGELGEVYDEQTAIKPDKDGWCSVVPDKYYGLKLSE